MAFRLEKFREQSHYKKLEEAWKGHNWPVVPASHLPSNGLVVVDEDTGQFLSAGFIYRTDSPIGWMEWIVTNPEAKIKKRTNSLNYLVSSLVGLAKEMGVQTLFATLKSKGLVKLYKKHGLRETEKEATNMIGKIAWQ